MNNFCQKCSKENTDWYDYRTRCRIYKAARYPGYNGSNIEILSPVIKVTKISMRKNVKKILVDKMS